MSFQTRMNLFGWILALILAGGIVAGWFLPLPD